MPGPEEERIEMSDGLRIVIAVSTSLIVVFVAVLATVNTIGLVVVTREIADFASGLGGSFEYFMDKQIEGGFAAPVIDPRDPLLVDRKVFVHHEINARTAQDVSKRLMLLNALDPTGPVDLYISTQGGWTDSAFTIIDTMRMIDAPVNTWAVGGCYSAGALIVAAGTGTRYSTEDAIIMVHANLDPDDPDDPYSYDRLEQARCERIWKATAELPEEWFPMTGETGYYLSPAQAVELGIVDEIVTVWPDQTDGG